MRVSACIKYYCTMLDKMLEFLYESLCKKKSITYMYYQHSSSHPLVSNFLVVIHNIIFLIGLEASPSSDTTCCTRFPVEAWGVSATPAACKSIHKILALSVCPLSPLLLISQLSKKSFELQTTISCEGCTNLALLRTPSFWSLVIHIHVVEL